VFREIRRSRTLLTVLLVTAFLLVTLDYRAGRGSPFDGVRDAVARVLGPVESGAAGAARAAGDVAARVRSPRAGDATLQRLARDNAALRARLAVIERPPSDAAAARLLRLAASARYAVVPARVVALGAGLGFSWTVTLDAGRRDGLRPDLTVVTGDGLVGRVKSVTDSTATVLLAADPSSRVGVRVGAAGEIGMVTGQARGPLRLEMLAADARLAVGDAVTTFGSPGQRPYAAGVAVGRIRRLLPSTGQGATALVEPAVRFSALDLVGVVTAVPRVEIRRPVVPVKRDPVVKLGRKHARR
jgi:rod shape-determining protein MreC